MERMLQGDMTCVKHAIMLIAVVARQVGDCFAPWYDPLMPVLKTVIEKTIHQVEERETLGKAFECVSLLATAVGCERFKPDAEIIMKAMVGATIVPNLPENDPVKE